MRRILVVDDARIMRESLIEIVEPEGYTVVAEACDGEEAVRSYRTHRPDVVFLDLVLPRRPGLEALSAIRALDPSARVLVCRALGQEALAAQAFASGARGCVAKPFHPDQVLSALEQLQKRLIRA